MIHNPTGLSTIDRIHRLLYQAENVYKGYLARQRIFEAISLSDTLPEIEREQLMIPLWHLAYDLGFTDLMGPVGLMSERFDPC